MNVKYKNIIYNHSDEPLSTLNSKYVETPKMDANSLDSISTIINQTWDLIKDPYWKRFDFWMFTVLNILGLVFSGFAFKEAREAKNAAKEAGKVVKIQSVLIDLTELGQKVNNLDSNIRFAEARALLTEISTKINRLVSPFRNEVDLKSTIDKLLDALAEAHTALNSVRPISSESESTVPQSVFYGIQENFSNISNYVAELLGLFEGKNFRIERQE